MKFYEYCWLKESVESGIDQVAGIGDDDENFHVEFSIKDLIKKAQKYPAKPVPISILLPFLKNREEDHSQTQARADNAELKYPIIVIANDKGKIFAIADGTHRVQKADELGMKEIQSHIIPKNDMAEFAVEPPLH